MASRNVISARTKIPLAAVGVLLVALSSWGCAAIARSMAKGIAQTSIERDLTLPRASAADFLACVERRGGARPQGQSPSATVSVTLGGHLKTGHWWTGQNRPPRRGRD